MPLAFGRNLTESMKKAPGLVFLMHAILGFALTQVTAQTPTPAPILSPSSTPEATPTLGDNFTQVLPDRRVTFRLLAPQANSVAVVVGTNNGEGTATTEMTKDSNGLWSVTLGPFDPNLYEYNFSLDGVKIADPGNGMPKPQRQVNTSLLLISGTPLIS
jgi:1,4-alpha-glucan branching enzyme